MLVKTSLVSAALEIVAQPLGDVGGFGGQHGIIVDSDQNGLVGLHDVDSALALLPTQHVLVAAEEKVLLSRQVDPGTRKRRLKVKEIFKTQNIPFKYEIGHVGVARN